MFAIIETGGKQYRVEEGDILDVELLEDSNPNQNHVFDKVLLVQNDSVHIGTPYVDGATIQATILEAVKDDKIIIFKKKPKKQYRRTAGHRQQHHRVRIEKIVLN
jgi:large subunit ribosomal protein L21